MGRLKEKCNQRRNTSRGAKKRKKSRGRGAAILVFSTAAAAKIFSCYSPMLWPCVCVCLADWGPQRSSSLSCHMQHDPRERVNPQVLLSETHKRREEFTLCLVAFPSLQQLLLGAAAAPLVVRLFFHFIIFKKKKKKKRRWWWFGFIVSRCFWDETCIETRSIAV